MVGMGDSCRRDDHNLLTERQPIKPASDAKDTAGSGKHSKYVHTHSRAGHAAHTDPQQASTLPGRAAHAHTWSGASIFISSNKAADWYMAAAAGGRPCYMRGKNCSKERAKARRQPEGAEPSG